MNKTTYLFLILLVVPVISSTTLAQQGASALPIPAIKFAPKNYVCYRSPEPLAIDGKLDETAWQNVQWTDEFIDIEGNAKPKPRFHTRAKMLWDDHYFYIAGEMEEPDVWATLKKRDSIIFYDNDFEVFIDPDGDTHQYYELEVNAFSTEWDLFLVKPYRDGGPALHAWDIQGLKTATTIDGTINQPGDRDRGWRIEIAIPWEILKECAPNGAPPQSNSQWRVNFSRVEWQTEVIDGKYEKVKNAQTGKPLAEDNWVWSPQGLVNMHYPEMWGYVQFSDQNAGDGMDQFEHKGVERAKWSLRLLYYAQQNWHASHGLFTDDILDLKLDDQQLSEYRWPPEIDVSWGQFEARLAHKDGKHFWHINHEGRVWQTEAEH